MEVKLLCGLIIQHQCGHSCYRLGIRSTQTLQNIIELSTRKECRITYTHNFHVHGAIVIPNRRYRTLQLYGENRPCNSADQVSYGLWNVRLVLPAQPRLKQRSLRLLRTIISLLSLPGDTCQHHPLSYSQVDQYQILSENLQQSLDFTSSQFLYTCTL